MGQQVKFYKKNKLDISNEVAVLTASQGNDYVDYVRNRSNESAWVTTGSVDADLTSLEVDFVDERDVDFIFLVKHNFKAYTIQYWNGSSYVDFSTPISETTNTLDVTVHSFTKVSTSKIKLIVQGTMTANQDKFLFQFIATEFIAQFDRYPIIRDPAFDRNLAKTKMLSGKTAVAENVGGFEVTLRLVNTKTAADLAIFESLFFSLDGFLVWLSGGDETQFFTRVKGYRKEDVYLMKCSNDYSPEFVKSLYDFGLDVSMKLVEVVD